MSIRRAWLGLGLFLAVACDREPQTDTAAAPTAQPTPSLAPEPAAPTPTPAAPTAGATLAEPAPTSASATAAPPAKPTARATAPKPAVTPTATASAPVRKVTTAVGSGASGEGFTLSIQAPTPVKTGETSSAVVVLKAVEPYKCNEKYPYKLVLDPPKGVSYPQTTVRGMSVAQKQSSMSVPFTATQPGSATIAGLMHFSICTDDKCLIEKRRVSVNVQVD